MKQKIVGTYRLGGEYVELVLREGTGGEFYYTPSPAHISRIKIGADYDEWRDIVLVFLHESMELALSRIKCRYSKIDDFGEDLHGYLFIMRHEDFSDACGRVADFTVGALPVLALAWKAWKRNA